MMPGLFSEVPAIFQLFYKSPDCSLRCLDCFSCSIESPDHAIVYKEMYRMTANHCDSYERRYVCTLAN